MREGNGNAGAPDDGTRGGGRGAPSDVLAPSRPGGAARRRGSAPLSVASGVRADRPPLRGLFLAPPDRRRRLRGRARDAFPARVRVVAEERITPALRTRA